jgi:hypothetical protein
LEGCAGLSLQWRAGAGAVFEFSDCLHASGGVRAISQAGFKTAEKFDFNRGKFNFQ